jgi:hypothetical protein
LSRISGPGCHKYGKINTYPFSQVVANEWKSTANGMNETRNWSMVNPSTLVTLGLGHVLLFSKLVTLPNRAY